MFELKKRISNFVFIFLIFLFTITLSACSMVKYEGNYLPEVSKEKPIVFITDLNSRPNAEQVLGYAEIDAPTTATTKVIKEKLKSKARSVGANVIRIVKMEKIPTGEARMDQRYNDTVQTWSVQDNSDASFRNMRDSLGTSSNSSSPGFFSGLMSGSFAHYDKKTVYRTFVRAEFRYLPETGGTNIP